MRLAIALGAAGCGALVVYLPRAAVPVALALLVVGLLAGWRRQPRPPAGEVAADQAPIAPPWWMNPIALFALITVPSLALTWLLAPQYFLDHWSTPKFFETRHLLVAAAAVAVAAIGVYVGRSLTGTARDARLRLSSEQVALLERAGRLLFWGALVGYGAWIAFAVARGLRPATVGAVLTGTPEALTTAKRSYLMPVAGITTLTQLAPVAATCLAIAKRLRPTVRAGGPLLTLAALALARTLLYGERLAILELAIPLVVVWLALAPRPSLRRTRSRRALVALAPVWAPIALVLFFGSFEYLRSWSSYYGQKEGGSYASFTIDRLGAYYATANNNTVLLIDADARSRPIPQYTLEWLWNFPVVGELSTFQRLTGVDLVEDWSETLEARANPEFNNTGGVLLPIYDFGVVGCLLFWALAGAVLGAVYQGFRNGSVLAWIAYPILFIGLLELPRILYWPQGRALPTIVAAVVVGVAVTRRATRTRALARPVGPATRAALSHRH